MLEVPAVLHRVVLPVGGRELDGDGSIAFLHGAFHVRNGKHWQRHRRGRSRSTKVIGRLRGEQVSSSRRVPWNRERWRSKSSNRISIHIKSDLNVFAIGIESVG